MATTSYLYHTLGLRSHRLIRTEFVGGTVRYHVGLKPSHRKCRVCGTGRRELTLEGQFRREFKTLPVGSRRQFIVLHGHEQRCRRCGAKAREPIDFADGKKRHTRSLERFTIDLCQIAPVKHVARLLGVSWTVVKDTFKQHLRRRLQKRSLREVRLIAVDEFAIRKGHQYMTVVLDLQTGEILHSAEGRSADSLMPFLRRLKAAGAQLTAVAMDMWPAYQLAVNEVFPGVDIVHDPYHIVANANAAIDATRRDIYSKLRGPARKILKGSRFLLLRGGERLDQSAVLHLQRLQSLNEPLFKAYLLKEDLRRLWSMPSLKKARTFFGAWIARALASRLKHFVKLAQTLRAHRHSILSYYKHHISTGPLEGMNNKIKVLKRQAYGFRDMEYLKLRLAFIHEDTPAFPG